MFETTSGKISGVQLNPATTQTTRYEYTEEISSDQEYTSCDEMGELSDSHSSQPSLSRPVTPSNPPQASSTHTSTKAPSTPEHFTLAHKAERILGLSPGTLPHARACLENARDEVRRTASPPLSPPQGLVEEGTGMRNRMNRARKVMSVALPSGVGMGLGRMGSVVVGTGGKEEEEKREKRRRAADGVLYWQKEVARLEIEEGRRR